MKNPSILQQDTAEMQAQKAIRKIKKWARDRYPGLASSRRARLILECLIELTEEQRLLAAR